MSNDLDELDREISLSEYDTSSISDDYVESDEEDGSKIAIPDGIGLSIEEIQALIAKYNKTIIEKDDPFLVVITILNAFMYENEKLQSKYLEALKNVYADQVKSYIKEVKKSTDSINATLKNVSQDEVIKLHEKQTEKITSFRNYLTVCTAVIACSALVNLVFFIWS